MSSSTGETFLTVRQVAARFGVRSRTVRDWIRRQMLEARRDQVTGALYVPVQAVQARAAQLKPWTPKGESMPKPAKTPSENPQAPPPGYQAAPSTSATPAKKPKKEERDIVDREIWGDDEEEE